MLAEILSYAGVLLWAAQVSPVATAADFPLRQITLLPTDTAPAHRIDAK